ncbi:delta-aminolevulinic acid dehydratase-like [Ylistrum balloti]|uniref:delta-aminolevulinic acid dehydratase-like n=1 Tax=Ylistrum balloti TaxID=509963 RepID=UPI0029059031|nr:delta-aminolevulinic acid dehydratase-like [Ylistrum balloti]
MVQENRLHPSDLIMPMFIKEGSHIKHPIQSMPGQYQWSPDQALLTLKEWVRKGVHSIILFGIPEKKDEWGSEGCNPNSFLIKTIQAIKNTFPSLLVISDICFCEYTDHGHCGLIINDDVGNDETLPLIAKQSLIHAQNGSDMIAPSGMMDGMVASIRKELDDHGFTKTPIMSYAVKYASSFYGPFREAAESTPSFGDRKTYQMNGANSDEALHEVQLDIEEGADILMVKPALPYLDILQRLKTRFNCPIAAYQVSGEYSMIKIACEKGLFDEKAIVEESLTSIKRAGANMIISYFTESIIQDL